MLRVLRNFTIVGFLMAGLMGSISACDSATPTTQLSTPFQPDPAYPGFLVTAEPTQPPSPISVSGPAFQIEGPLVAGATHLAGKGPKNIPIIVADITMNAKELARVVISPDGQFSVTLSEPLNAGDRIGLVVGPVADNVASNFDFQTKLYELHGTGYMYIPNLAHVYDSALVEPGK